MLPSSAAQRVHLDPGKSCRRACTRGDAATLLRRCCRQTAFGWPAWRCLPMSTGRCRLGYRMPVGNIKFNYVHPEEALALTRTHLCPCLTVLKTFLFKLACFQWGTVQYDIYTDMQFPARQMGKQHAEAFAQTTGHYDCTMLMMRQVTFLFVISCTFCNVCSVYKRAGPWDYGSLES